ncbi:MAG: hypothetical protein WC761_01750 [Candidatus Paceibacterota bacterium]|jgi:hypothetical protein
MGIRNKVGSTGWVSTKINGTAVEVDMSDAVETVAGRQSSTLVPVGTTVSMSAPVGILAATAAGTTASLPAIGAANVGKTYQLFNSGSTSTFVTSSNLINGGAWTRTLVTPYTISTFIAYSSSIGYGWVASSGSSI